MVEYTPRAGIPVPQLGDKWKLTFDLRASLMAIDALTFKVPTVTWQVTNTPAGSAPTVSAYGSARTPIVVLGIPESPHIKSGSVDSETGTLHLTDTAGHEVTIDGLRGPQGLPGANAEAADTAVASYLGTTGTSATQSAGDKRYRRKTDLPSVRDFGAAGDGTTNDLTALNKAAAAVPTKGGKLHLPEGTFSISSRISALRAGTVLEGSGPGTILKIASSAFDVLASDVTVRNLTIQGTGTSGLFNKKELANAGHFKNWRFENCRFVGMNITASRLGAIQYDNGVITSGSDIAEYLEFDHCEFTGGTADGLQNLGIDYFTVNRCSFHDLGTDQNTGEALKVSSGAKYWRFLHCDFARIARDGIDTFDAYRGLIDGCTIVDTGAQGIEMKENAFNLPNPTDRNIVTNVRTLRTGKAAPTAPAIQVAISNATVTNCLIEEPAGIGIRIGASAGPTPAMPILMGNRVLRAGGSGFQVSVTTDATVIGNAASGCGEKGFLVPGTTNPGFKGGASMNASSGNAVIDTWP